METEFSNDDGSRIEVMDGVMLGKPIVAFRVVDGKDAGEYIIFSDMDRLIAFADSVRTIAARVKASGTTQRDTGPSTTERPDSRGHRACRDGAGRNRPGKT